MSDDNDDLFTEHHTPGELLDELGSLKELLDEEYEGVVPYTSVSEISSVEDYLQLKKQADSAGMEIEAYLHQQAEAQQTQPVEPDGEVLELLEDDDEAIPLLDEVYLVEDESDEGGEEDGDSLLLKVAEDEAEEPVHPPSTDEATTVEEYFAAVAAKRPHIEPQQTPAQRNKKVTSEEAIPVLDEVFTTDEAIPVLDEVFSADEAVPVLDEVATDNAFDTDEVMSLNDVQQLVDLIVSRKLEHLKAELEKEVMGELQKLLPLSTFTKS